MSSFDNPRSVEALSDAKKIELIFDLLKELKEERARSQALVQQLAQLEHASNGSRSEVHPLLAELRKHGVTKPMSRPALSGFKIRLGALSLLPSKWVIAMAAIGALAFLLDYGIGQYQSHALKEKRLVELRLERAAYSNLFVELVSVAYEPDHKSYRVTMAMQSLNPEHPVYVMLNPIRVFEQSGLAWKEVPAHSPDGSASGIVKLTSRHLYQSVFTPNLTEWAELMPGYMHIRFDNDMLISQRSEPDEDIVARKDPYYVYLKPLDADDEAIRKKMNYPGEPPVYIPMPPH